MKIWLNGTLVDAEAPCISASDRGFTLGDGLFETLQARGGAVLRLDAHLARLRRGAGLIGLHLPRIDYSLVFQDVLSANSLLDAALRLTVTRGPAPRGVLPPALAKPTMVISVSELPPTANVRLVVAQTTRRNEFSPLSGIKSLSYLDNILARQEAASRGVDDALMLNTQARIAETSMANVFVVKDGSVMTPPLHEGALPGVMRAEVLKLGAIEHPIVPGDLAKAQELFITTSLGIRSVEEVETRPLGDFSVARQLREKLG